MRYRPHQTMTLNFIFVALLYSLATTGCGTWAGNPKDPDPDPIDTSTKVVIDFQGNTDSDLQLLATPIEVLGKQGTVTGSVILNSARVSLRKIKLRSLGGGHDSQEFKGPYIVNLITNTITPTMEPISVTAGKYRDIKMQLARLEEDEVPAELEGDDPLIDNSIHLVGTYTQTGSAPKNFELTFDLDEEFLIPLTSSRSEFSLGKSITNKVIVAFSMHEWFDLSGSEVDFDDFSEDEIILEKDSKEFAKEMRKSVKDNIKGSAKFGRDKDGNGKLDKSDENDDDEEEEKKGQNKSQGSNSDEDSEDEDSEDEEKSDTED